MEKPPGDNNLVNLEYRTVKRVNGLEFPIEKCYVHVSKIEQLRYKNDEPKKTVLFSELLSDERHENRALIQARVGIGKTTFCRKFVHDFLSQKHDYAFQFVFCIPLRSLMRESFEKGWNLFTYLCRHCFPHSESKAIEFFNFYKEHRKDYCVILDGLDEVKDIVNNDHLPNFLRGFLSPNDNGIRPGYLIATARQYGVSEWAKHTFSHSLFEIHGFDTEDVENYIKVVARSPTEKIDISNFIQASPTLSRLVNVPILLDILCVCFPNLSSGLGNNRITMTCLYTHLFRWMWTQYAGKDFVDVDPSQVETRFSKEIEFLQTLAFTGLKDNKLEFKSFPSSKEKGEDLDLIAKLRKSTMLHSEDENGTRIHSFLHVTFQDYYSARHIVDNIDNDEEVRTWVLHHKYDRGFQTVSQFIAGLITEERQLQSYFNLIEMPPRDLLAGRHGPLMSGCLLECGEALVGEKRLARLSREILEWAKYDSKSDRGWIQRSIILPEQCIELLFNDLEGLRYSPRTPEQVWYVGDLEHFLYSQVWLSPKFALQLLEMKEMSNDAFRGDYNLPFSPACVLRRQRGLSPEFWEAYNSKWKGAEGPLVRRLLSCIIDRVSLPEDTVNVLVDAIPRHGHGRSLTDAVSRLQIVSQDNKDMIQTRMKALLLNQDLSDSEKSLQMNDLASFLQTTRDLYQTHPEIIESLISSLLYFRGTPNVLRLLSAQVDLGESALESLLRIAVSEKSSGPVAIIAIREIRARQNVGEKYLNELSLALKNDKSDSSLKWEILSVFINQQSPLPTCVVKSVREALMPINEEEINENLPPGTEILKKILILVTDEMPEVNDYDVFVHSLLPFNLCRLQELVGVDELDLVIDAFLSIIKWDKELKALASSVLRSSSISNKDLETHISKSLIWNQEDKSKWLKGQVRASHGFNDGSPIIERRCMRDDFLKDIKSFCRRIHNGDKNADIKNYKTLVQSSCGRGEALLIIKVKDGSSHFRIPGEVNWRLELGASGDNLEAKLMQWQKSIEDFPFSLNAIDLVFSFKTLDEGYKFLDSLDTSCSKQTFVSAERKFGKGSMKHACVCTLYKNEDQGYLKLKSEYKKDFEVCRCTGYLASISGQSITAFPPENLQHLDLRGNRFTDMEAMEFQGIFKNCKNITSFILSDNQITKAGMTTLLRDIITLKSKLKHLLLAYNLIFLEEKDFEGLNSQLSLTSLQTLDLHMNFLSDDFLQKVKKECGLEHPVSKCYSSSIRKLCSVFDFDLNFVKEENNYVTWYSRILEAAGIQITDPVDSVGERGYEEVENFLFSGETEIQEVLETVVELQQEFIDSGSQLEPPNQASCAPTQICKYKLEEFLDFGSFGIVFSAISGNEKIAVKFLCPRGVKGQKEELIKECETMTRPDNHHPNLVKVLGLASLRCEELREVQTLIPADLKAKDFDVHHILTKMADPGKLVYCIEMELCGRTLRSWLMDLTSTRGSIELATQIAGNIIAGLKFLHGRSILHRDLKPENIYFSVGPGQYPVPVKIGDFGQCREVSTTCTRTQSHRTAFSKIYRAPEAAMDNQIMRYGENADWYSFGLILYEIFYSIQKNELDQVFNKLLYGRIISSNPCFSGHESTLGKVNGLVTGLVQEKSESREKSVELLSSLSDVPEYLLSSSTAATSEESDEEPYDLC